MGVRVLSKGEVLELKHKNLLRFATVGIGWSTQKSVALDAAAVLRDSSGKTLYTVNYHNAKGNPFWDVNVQAEWCDHLGYNTVGREDSEQIKIDLIRSSADVAIVDFCITVHDLQRKGYNFSMVGDVYLRIVNDESHQEMLRYEVQPADLSDHVGMIVGRLVRQKSIWVFKAVGDARAEFQDLQSIADYVLPTF